MDFFAWNISTLNMKWTYFEEKIRFFYRMIKVQFSGALSTDYQAQCFTLHLSIGLFPDSYQPWYDIYRKVTEILAYSGVSYIFWECRMYILYFIRGPWESHNKYEAL